MNVEGICVPMNVLSYFNKVDAHYSASYFWSYRTDVFLTHKRVCKTYFYRQGAHYTLKWGQQIQRAVLYICHL